MYHSGCLSVCLFLHPTCFQSLISPPNDLILRRRLVADENEMWRHIKDDRLPSISIPTSWERVKTDDEAVDTLEISDTSQQQQQEHQQQQPQQPQQSRWRL